MILTLREINEAESAFRLAGQPNDSIALLLRNAINVMTSSKPVRTEMELPDDDTFAQSIKDLARKHQEYKRQFGHRK